MGIFEEQVKEIYKTLSKKNYIFSNPTYLRTSGEIRKVLANRDINIETLKNANRFIISSDNIFYKDSQKGVFISFEDIIKINSYGYNKKDKRYSAKNRDRLLLIYLIITKIAFYNNQYSNTRTNPLFARFKIKELNEFLGWSYKTVLEHIKHLTEYHTYNQEGYKIFYNLGKKEEYQEVYKKFNIAPFQSWQGKEVTLYNEFEDTREIKKDTDRTLYFIDTEALKQINIYFETLEKKTDKFL